MTPLRVDSEQPLFSAPYRPGRFTQKEQFQPPQPEDGGAIFIGMAVTLAGLAILLFIRATIRLLRFWRRRECLWARMQAARRRRCERRQQRAQRRAERREKFLAMRERLMAWFRRVGSLVRRLGWAAADDEEKNAMFRQDRLEQRQAVLDSHNSVQSPAVAAENASVARAAAAPPAHHAPTVDPRTATVPVTRTHRRRDSDSFSLDSSSSDNSHHSAGTSTSTSSGSTTLEQDLALFRSAADVVSDLLVAAEEGRSAASSRRQLEREHHYRRRARARREAAGSIHRYLLDGVPERLAEWIRRHYNPVAAAAAGAAPPTLPTHHVHMPIPIPTDTNRNGLTMHGHPANPQPMLPPSPSSSQFGSDDETLSVTDSLPAYEDVATLSDREHGVVADGIRFHRHGVGSHAHSRRTSGSSTPETRPSMEVIRQAGRVDDVLGPDTKN